MPVIKNEAQMDMPDDHLKEIGRILVCWNSLEHLLDASLVIALLGDGPDGKARAVLAHMAVDQKINSFESILRLIDVNPNGMGEIFKTTVKPSIVQSKDKRNEMVHHFWAGWNGTVYRSNINARGKLKVTTTIVPLEDLIEVSNFISNARKTLQEFCLSHLLPAMGIRTKGKN